MFLLRWDFDGIVLAKTFGIYIGKIMFLHRHGLLGNLSKNLYLLFCDPD
jgi:hypothetical protein